MKVSVVSGADRIKRRVTLAQAAVISAVENGLYLALNNVMTRSKQLVPVDSGALRASGYVSRPERGPTSITVRLGYGGPAAAYALVQHEGFFNHPGGGQRRFLSEPMDAAAPTLVATAGAFAARQLAQVKGARPQPLPRGGHPTDPNGGGTSRASKARHRRRKGGNR